MDDILTPVITSKEQEHDILSTSRARRAAIARKSIYTEYRSPWSPPAFYAYVPCSIQQVRQHLKQIEVSGLNLVVMSIQLNCLQPTLRCLCQSLHQSGTTTTCRWICSYCKKKLGVQLSEAQLKQQCTHLFPIDSCTPLVSTQYINSN